MMPAAPPPKLPEESSPAQNKPESLSNLVQPHYPPAAKRGPDPRKRKPDRRSSGLYLPIWSLVLMLLTVFGIVGGAIFLVITLGGPRINTTAEPIILVVTAQPSETPFGAQSILASPTLPAQATFAAPAESVALSGPTLAPTATFTPTPPVITVGATVIVVSVSGVNVRSAPGLTSEIALRADVNQTFTVIDGPQEVDGLTWWRVREPFAPGREGWAAESNGSEELLEVFVQ